MYEPPVYLPDELGAQAKEAKLNFSQLLRGRVEAELNALQAIRARAGEAVDWELDLESESGHAFKGRVRGTLLVEGGRGAYLGSQIIVTNDHPPGGGEENTCDHTNGRGLPCPIRS